MQGKKYIVTDTEKQKVYQMITKGYNIYQIIEKLGICDDTWRKYKDDFRDTIKEATELKEIRDLQETKNALRKKIEGFEVEEKTYKTKILEDGTEIEYLAERKVKQVLPDTTAIIFDLVNKSNGEFVSINNQKETVDKTDINETIKKLMENG